MNWLSNYGYKYKSYSFNTTKMRIPMNLTPIKSNN